MLETMRHPFLAVFLPVALAGCAATPPPGLPPLDGGFAAGLAAEIRANETGLAGDDAQALAPFGAAVGDATMVGLGETSHGVAEMIATKSRLFKYLVATKGFTVFTLEAPWTHGWPIERYLQAGEGDPRELVKANGFYTWNNQPMLDLVLWMRQYNQDAGHARKLHFVSIDCQSPDEVAGDVQAYVDAHLPDQAGSVRTRYAFLRSRTYFDYGQLDIPAQAACRRDLAKVAGLLQQTLEAAGAKADAELLRARQAAEVVLQGEKVWASASLTNYGGTRDPAMAANVEWVSKVAFPGERLALCAANAHVATDPLSWLGSMGSYLRAAHGQGYYTLGFSFHHGAIYGPAPDVPFAEHQRNVLPVPSALPGSLDALFHEAGQPFAFLDLRRLDPATALGSFLAGPIYARVGGAGYVTWLEEGNYQRFSPRNAFDALIFIDEVTPAITL
ncbi:MAG: uncharacterized protein JWM80_4942 [Cyanobacteria bacterium RYN_339]|nr:uncharacterized protein [Cyanobacteria bacterium RYN_339]